MEAAERLEDGAIGRDEGTRRDKQEDVPVGEEGMQQGGGPVWHKRSASVASLWCLAVRLGVAMGQRAACSWGSGLRRSSVFASLSPSLFLKEFISACTCVCLF